MPVPKVSVLERVDCITFVHSYITIVLSILPKSTVATSFIATTSKRLDCVCPTELGKGSLSFLVI